MKRTSRVTLIAIFAVAAFTTAAMASDRCVPYGDENTEFTWRLCPSGEKFERQYLYFGAWSRYYPVRSDSGECRWSGANSSWICPEKTIRCDARRCG